VPIFGVLWAWLALGESLTLSMAAGGALILGGMLYAQGKPRAARVPRPRALNRRCADGGA
jgi:drug/metabolite transporter (DMT)-like permease